MNPQPWSDEPRRLGVLRDYEILDTPPEECFDDLTSMAACICEAPIALLSLVDEKRQWFKSKKGVPMDEMPREISFCAHAIHQPGMFIVPDAREDARFADNPLVTQDPHIRFYAGQPLISPEGVPLGTLCILDYEERQLSPDHEKALRILARHAMAQLDLRRKTRELTRQRDAAQAAETARAAATAAKAAAEAAAAAKDRFLANLSHELRTPLTPVLATLSALETDADLPPRIAEDVHMMRSSIAREGRLIDDLLDLAALSHQRLRVELRPLDVHAVLNEAVDQWTPQAADNKVTLRLQPNANRHHVSGDRQRLAQIFDKLLDNAVKFSRPGGAVIVSTRTLSSGRWQMQVVDEGVGISPQRLPRLFECEHSQLTTAGGHNGLGLGLLIAKSLLELHRGTICIDSGGSGRGTCATITLPVIDASLVEETLPPMQQVRTPRLLFVEDDRPTATVLAKLLRREGYDVRVANTVSEAAAAAASETFDLVVSDIGLPDGTGWDVISQLKSRQRIPSIALSGYGMESDVTRSKAAGFDSHLTKPIELPQLLSEISNLLANKPRA